VTRRQLSALDELMNLMRKSSACDFAESLPLLDGIRDMAETRATILEE